jgi:hypothetical protein
MSRTCWCFSLIYLSLLTLLSVGGATEHRFTGHVTASSGQDATSAQKAMDGDMQTRWSSDFTDDEWWQIAFGQPERLAGLQIIWEQAHGEHYVIQVSDDGTQWHTVFEEAAGDGKTDWIFFAPVTTRFLRLQGRQRGTGWGYSIWEIRPLPDSAWPRVEASSTLAGSQAQHMMDGKAMTFWHSAAPASAHVLITLPYPIALGGLEIVWGADFATSYAVELATADGQWHRVARVSQGNGKEDFVYFPATQTAQLKLLLERSNNNQGYAIDEIRLKDEAEQATPLRLYQAVAKERPRGWYPRWLSREQEFWTITGVPGDAEESLLGESGIFEPYKEGFTVMPFVQTGGRLLTWADTRVEQALEEEYVPLPRVTWQTDTWSLTIATVSFGQAGAASTAVQYRLSNSSPQRVSGRLILAVRPVQLNPKWQRGGFSPLHTIEAVPHGAGQALQINGHHRLIAPVAPSQVVALTLDQGTVLDCLYQDTCVPQRTVTDEEGKSEAALVYDFHLEPGGHNDVVLFFPLQAEAASDETWADPATVFRQHVQEQLQYWRTLLQQVSITIPEQKLIHVLKSNLAYILLNQDGPWIKPGPRNYNHSWLRDGAMTSLALLRLGLAEPVRRFLLAYRELVDAQGWVPWIVFENGAPVAFATDSREGHEYDSQGQFPFLVRHYVDFTGDTAMLAAAYPAVVRALHYGSALRRERMTEPYRTQPQLAAYYGILPESNSHEGYYPAQHSYWDDFWYLRGLKDGIALAARLGQGDDSAWMRAELQDARQALYTSMQRVIARDHLEYLPGCVEKGDFDATSTAIAIMVSDEAAYLPQPYAANTFDRYYADFLTRLVPHRAQNFTPYEVRTAEAFVRMGERQRALSMLRAFTTDAMRPLHWNHLAEVVHGRERAPSYIGDMPHTWVGSSYISAVRSLFVYEADDRLILAAGIAPEWVQEGISVHHLPTPFGDVNYVIRDTVGRIHMHIWGEAAPPGGFSVPLPQAWQSKVARLNGEVVTPVDASFRFATLPVRLELQERTPHDRTSQ